MLAMEEQDSLPFLKTLTFNMGKRHTVKIDRFDGGISNDLRTNDHTKFAITEHFDTHTYHLRLKPYRSHEADEQSKTPLIRKFVAGERTASGTPVLWGLGESSGKPALVFHNITPETPGWSTPADNAAANNVNFNFVFYYSNQVFGMQTNGDLFSYDTVNATMTDQDQDFSAFTTFAEPVHHPADDRAYFFTDNVVHKLNNTTWSLSVLTLPTNQRIVDATPYGNYLAIACTPKGNSTYARSNIVYLWDRDSSLTTISNKIDFGRGTLKYIAELDGRLIAVVDKWVNSPEDADRAELVVLGATSASNSATVLNRIPSIGSTNVISSLKSKVVEDNILYFPFRLTNGIVSSVRDGIYSVNSRGAITLEVVEEDLTDDDAVIDGISRLAGFWFIAHDADGSVERTDDNSNYTYTSIYESLIFDNGDVSINKKLLGVTVTTVPLPTAGQIVLQYRVNEESSWTTIFTNATDNSVRHSAVNIESSGVNFNEYNEVQFRIQSTGNAEITSLKFESEEIPDDVYK